jgi:predicted metalloprotease
MKWTAGNRDNVDDVRASSGGGGMRMGGLGVGGLLVVLVLSWLTGVDFLQLLGPNATAPPPAANTGGGELATTPEE